MDERISLQIAAAYLDFLWRVNQSFWSICNSLIKYNYFILIRAYRYWVSLKSFTISHCDWDVHFDYAGIVNAKVCECKKIKLVHSNKVFPILWSWNVPILRRRRQRIILIEWRKSIENFYISSTFTTSAFGLLSNTHIGLVYKNKFAFFCWPCAILMAFSWV